MALKSNELFQETDGVFDKPIDAHRIIPVKVGPSAGEETYVPGTLMAYDTVNDYYVGWDPAGANGVEIAKGVLWPDPLTLDAADESIAQLMVMGTVRLEDLTEGDGITATPTDIQDAVKATFRDLGIIVQNLDTVR